MEAYKTKTKVRNNHKVQLEDVPFDDGQEIEIIISVSIESENNEKPKDSLKGSVIKYDGPFEPAITSDDWELLK